MAIERAGQNVAAAVVPIDPGSVASSTGAGAIQGPNPQVEHAGVKLFGQHKSVTSVKLPNAGQTASEKACSLNMKVNLSR